MIQCHQTGRPYIQARWRGEGAAHPTRKYKAGPTLDGELGAFKKYLLGFQLIGVNPDRI